MLCKHHHVASVSNNCFHPVKLKLYACSQSFPILPSPGPLAATIPLFCVSDFDYSKQLIQVFAFLQVAYFI